MKQAVGFTLLENRFLGFSVSGSENLVSSLPSYSVLNGIPRTIGENPLRGLPNAIDEISLDDISNAALPPITELREHRLLADVFSGAGKCWKYFVC